MQIFSWSDYDDESANVEKLCRTSPFPIMLSTHHIANAIVKMACRSSGSCLIILAGPDLPSQLLGAETSERRGCEITW